MADITFVKNTWGYSAPGADLKPANLQKLDDALNAVTHKASRGSALLDADLLLGKDLTLQTPLNSGLVCAPMATVPEWPDGAATYLQGTLPADPWTGWVTDPAGGVTVSNGNLRFAKTVPSQHVNSGASTGTMLAGKTVKGKVRLVSGTPSNYTLNIINTAVSPSSIALPSDGSWASIDSVVSTNGTNIGFYLGAYAGSETYTIEFDWIYIGDGTYTSKALDGSGQGNHGLVYGATPVDTAAGRGFSFDGVNDVVQTAIPSSIFRNEFSVGFLVTPSLSATLTNGRVVDISSDVSVTNGFAAIYSAVSKSIAFQINAADAGLTANNSLLLGVSNHIFYSITALGAYKIYINGVQSVSGTAAQLPSTITTSGLLAFGNRQGLTRPFYGLIADSRIYNRALSAEEVWELYSKPGMAKVSGPVDSVTAVPNSRVVRDASGLNISDDALKVSGYGIGVTSPVAITTDLVLNATLKGGVYSVQYATGSAPFPGADFGPILVIPYDSGDVAQIAFGTAFGSKVVWRSTADAGATWTGWRIIWDSASDGNGGQPPSAKSNKTSNTTIGWFDSVDCASGAQVTLPTGGTFEWFVSTYGATYNSAKSGVSAGGLMTGTASANLTMWYKRLS